MTLFVDRPLSSPLTLPSCPHALPLLRWTRPKPLSPKGKHLTPQIGRPERMSEDPKIGPYSPAFSQLRLSYGAMITMGPMRPLLAMKKCFADTDMVSRQLRTHTPWSHRLSYKSPGPVSRNCALQKRVTLPAATGSGPDRTTAHPRAHY